MHLILLAIITYCVDACSISNVTKAPMGQFIADSMFVSGNDTLILQYNDDLQEVKVLTKDYYFKKDNVQLLWLENCNDPRMAEIVASNVKIIKPTIAEWREKGMPMLSEKALSSVFSEEKSCGWFTIYFIYSLSADNFQDYGFSLSWYNSKILLSEKDIESVLNIIKDMQFQYIGNNFAVDKICLNITIPIRAEK